MQWREDMGWHLGGRFSYEIKCQRSWREKIACQRPTCITLQSGIGRIIQGRLCQWWRVVSNPCHKGISNIISGRQWGQASHGLEVDMLGSRAWVGSQSKIRFFPTHPDGVFWLHTIKDLCHVADKTFNYALPYMLAIGGERANLNSICEYMEVWDGV